MAKKWIGKTKKDKLRKEKNMWTTEMINDFAIEIWKIGKPHLLEMLDKISMDDPTLVMGTYDDNSNTDDLISGLGLIEGLTSKAFVYSDIPSRLLFCGLIGVCPSERALLFANILRRHNNKPAERDLSPVPPNGIRVFVFRMDAKGKIDFALMVCDFEVLKEMEEMSPRLVEGE